MFVFVKQKTAYEMRISDWSSDVCSSDLAVDVVGQVVDDGEAGARRTLVGARQRLEVDVVDRAVVAVAIDQVDERIADALDGGDVQLHRPGRRLDHPGAPIAGALAGRRRVLKREGDGADSGEDEHKSDLLSLMRQSYAVFCFKHKISTTVQDTS